MTGWDLVSAVCVAVGSSYLTLAVVAETEPYINEEGEEEYLIKGYLLLAGAAVVKWGLRKIMRMFKGNNNNQKSVEDHKPNFEMDREANDHELII